MSGSKRITELSPTDAAVAGDVGEAIRSLQAMKEARTASRSDLLNLRLLLADRTTSAERLPRIAIASLLFNWPSTGGGTVHTMELTWFLRKQGLEVCHFYARHQQWGVGTVTESLPYPHVPIDFSAETFDRQQICSAFREHIGRFNPDYVIVTDSWNFKPILANALGDFKTLLRLAALECICPLNNVRLRPAGTGFIQCDRSQLATPQQCRKCVTQYRHTSGSLHEAERQLAAFDSVDYAQELKAAFSRAAAVLAVNPIIGAACEPHCQRVAVIASGFDASRFENLPANGCSRPRRLLFAGLVDEYMKGFHVLLAACRKLWRQRQDFELCVTSDEATANYQAPFLRWLGWQSQAELPGAMARSFAVIVPTIAQEALGRTAVEAMGAGRPVVASRIGGLPFVVADEQTGLLFEPGDVDGLAGCIERLLNHPAFAQNLGENGREAFFRDHTWEAKIVDQYLSLFRSMEESQ